MISQWCFVYKTNTVFPLVVQGWRLCLDLYEESNLFWFTECQYHFSTPLACQYEYDPQ